MAGATPDTAAQRWVEGLGRAGDKIRSGVQAVTVSPGQAAARQKSAYLAGVQAKADTWARRVSAVPLSDWQNSMTTKGIDRIGSGAAAAQPKFQTFMAKFLPAVQAAKAALPPRGSYEQNKARANAMMDALHKFTA